MWASFSALTDKETKSLGGEVANLRLSENISVAESCNYNVSNIWLKVREADIYRYSNF